MTNLEALTRTRIISKHCVYITRVLSKGSQVLVAKNQEVSPNEAVFLSQIPSTLWGIDLSKKFKINPKMGLKYLKKNIGETVSGGEVIAVKTNLLKKIEIKTPVSGLLHSYDEISGRLVIKTPLIDVPILSGVYGSIQTIDKAKQEIKIKTMAREVLGIVGQGVSVGGVLKKITRKSQINVSLRGSIIFSNLLFTKVDLLKMQSFGVAGILVGGLNVLDYQTTTIPVILTEGFGAARIGSDIQELLTDYEEKFVYMLASQSRLLLPEDDEAVILTVRKIGLPENLPDNNQDFLKLKPIKKGDSVRVISNDLLGRQGQVLAIDQTETRIESGQRVVCVMIDLSGKKIKVPINNIELI